MREVEVDQQDTDQVYFQNLQKLEQCINSDLANNYGNLCQRVMAFM